MINARASISPSDRFDAASTTGLFILGVIIFVTMRRDRARDLVGRVRTRLRGWE